MANILFTLFIIFVVLNVPIGIAIGLSTFGAILASQKVPLFLVAQRLFTGLDSFPLLAIPLFMIAGSLMESGGISKRLINFASNIVGPIPGGLAMVTVLACMFFAAISGSAPATVVAIGSIMVPAMIEAGYDKDFAVGLIAASGMIGVLIPPSIPFVTYGITMNASIGKLFLAGIVPGVLFGLSFMIISYFYAKKRGYKGTAKPTWKSFLTSFKEAIWALGMPAIILGGIYGGVFTPTEAAAVACVYSLIVGFFIYRELTLQNMFKSFANAGVSSAMVGLIIAAATAMGWVLTTEQVPTNVATAISSIAHSKFMLLLLINLILLITGCLMELNAAIIILGPIFLPLIMQYNIDIIHFGVIMVVNLTIGLLTPPLGVNLFVANGLQKDLTLSQVVKASLPFMIFAIIDLMILTYVPNLSLYLTHLLK
ncbi:TRAP transporter large permease [Carboxydothermus hydrogenoformans]|uniref:TRAP dicarboxylate transporter, DctM subunit n=1 Tax=Carboxydothermus hydrogenoformans (strain ATCC BAA-161 / DSM 6008 / Z-2901) TaxID=246194 RepID=Q3ACJ7_CARHZ|nr:TRAP transporter large permease [Carboxydothermus hydrogenoformans]ABB14060.1 TRAP dicarboxylate transporter, DctM subunit [Carboxydothermus hydrogenoformans Z-2901]